jgi:hypothetical protein
MEGEKIPDSEFYSWGHQSQRVPFKAALQVRIHQIVLALLNILRVEFLFEILLPRFAVLY